MVNSPSWPKHLFYLPGTAARWTRLLGVASLVGVGAGLAAAGLEAGLHFGTDHLVGRFTHLGQANTFTFRWELLLLPTIGGLVSGLLVRWLCPRAVGHGTDVLVHAFHQRGGALELRGPAFKGAASIGVISCGGSAGPEGPIAALGAALGSSIARLLSLTPRERRLLLVAGCGAGVGAIFRCPLGGALFAASILYREPDFETEALAPAFVASVLGYSVYMSFHGYGEPLLVGADKLVFTSPRELIPCLALGLICAALCAVFRTLMHFMEHVAVPRSRLPLWLTPALGGLATGAVACALPQVMDGQYAFVRNIMAGNLMGGFAAWSWWHWAALFAAVAVAKCVATALTVGSGASGGVLGPAVFIGGVAGAFVGAVVSAIGPEWFTGDPENLRRALIPLGMAGVLAAGMRAPLASLVMVSEMTGSHGLIVPLMLVCVSAYATGRRWGLNDAQVRSVAESPAHAGDTVVHLLETWRVHKVMRRVWPETVSPATTLQELVELAQPGTQPVFAVVEADQIVGLISLPDIERIMDEPSICEAVIAADLMTPDFITIHPDEDVYTALTRMARDNQIVVPVVTRGAQPRFCGMLTRADVHNAVHSRLDELRQHLLGDHAGLAAMENEEQLHQLVMGVAPPRGHNIQRLLVPVQAVGKSLRETDFRRQFGVQVIAVEQPDGSISCPPDPDVPLSTRQRLVAIVTERQE